MASQSLQAISDPDAFFRRLRDGSGLVRPAALVVGAGLLSVVDTFVYQQQLQSALSTGGGAGAGAGKALLLLLTVVRAVIKPVLAWVVLAVVFYLVSTRFGGEGSPITTAKFVGWGFLPVFALSVLTTTVSLSVITTTPTPTNASEMGTYIQSISQNGFLKTAKYLPIAFTVWQGFMWTFALRHARELSLRDAAKTVAGPVAVLVAWTAYVQVSGTPQFVYEIPFAGFFVGGGGIV